MWLGGGWQVWLGVVGQRERESPQGFEVCMGMYGLTYSLYHP